MTCPKMEQQWIYVLYGQWQNLAKTGRPELGHIREKSPKYYSLMDNLAEETQLYWLQISVNKKPLWNFSCPRIIRPFGCPLPGHHHHDLDLDLGRAGNTTYIYTIRPKQLVSLACGGGSYPIWLFSMTLQRSCLKQLGSFAFGEIEEKIRFWLNRCPTFRADSTCPECRSIAAESIYLKPSRHDPGYACSSGEFERY